MITIMLDRLQSPSQVERTFRAGQYLFHRDDRVKSMFLVMSGAVHLIRHHRSGSAVILQRAGPGSILAEASLFASKYHCDAIATSEVVARLISRAEMQKLFFNDPGFAREWAVHLAEEVRNARQRAEILSIKTVSERLDAWLSDKERLPEKGGWRELAAEIGTSPEALYREIARRRKTGRYGGASPRCRPNI